MFGSVASRLPDLAPCSCQDLAGIALLPPSTGASLYVSGGLAVEQLSVSVRLWNGTSSLPQARGAPQGAALTLVAALVLPRGSCRFSSRPGAVTRLLSRAPTKPAVPEPSQTKINADDVVSAVKPLLEEWRRNAGEGVMVFADADLNDAIRNQHFDDSSWFRSLVGNLTWAAACFATGGTAFTISVSGILAGLPPFKADQKDTTLIKIEKRMLNHLDGLLIALRRQLPTVSAQVVAKPDVTTKEEAVERVLRLLFRPPFLIPPTRSMG
jgi:hypothetical protein